MTDHLPPGAGIPCDVCGLQVPSLFGIDEVGVRPVVRCQDCARRLHIVQMLDACDGAADVAEWVPRLLATIRARFSETGRLSDAELSNLETVHRTITEAKRSDEPPPVRLNRPQQRAWMLDLGRHIRRTREFLGLTQTDLATLAGTSQAAVSRLEQGRAMGTPYLVVLAVQRSLCASLRQLSPSVPTSGGYLGHPSMLAEVDGVEEIDGPPDVELARLVSLYRRSPIEIRRHLVSIVEVIVPPR